MGDGQLRWKDTPILAKKTWSASKNATPPDNDRFRGSFTSVSPESPDHYVGWVRGMIWCFSPFFPWKETKKNVSPLHGIAKYSQDTCPICLIVFLSIWKWSRQIFRKKNAEKTQCRPGNLARQRPQKRKWKLSHLDLFTVIFLLSTILDDLFPTFGVLLKKWPRFRGQDFLGKVDVFTDWDPMGWKSPSKPPPFGRFLVHWLHFVANPRRCWWDTIWIRIVYAPRCFVVG